MDVFTSPDRNTPRGGSRARAGRDRGAARRRVGDVPGPAARHGVVPGDHGRREARARRAASRRGRGGVRRADRGAAREPPRARRRAPRAVLRVQAGGLRRHPRRAHGMHVAAERARFFFFRRKRGCRDARHGDDDGGPPVRGCARPEPGAGGPAEELRDARRAHTPPRRVVARRPSAGLVLARGADREPRGCLRRREGPPERAAGVRAVEAHPRRVLRRVRDSPQNAVQRSAENHSERESLRPSDAHRAAFAAAAEELYDVVAAYFPVSFRPPPGDTIKVTHEQLASTLRDAMCASPVYAPWAVPHVLESVDPEKPARGVADALATSPPAARRSGGQPCDRTSAPSGPR